MAVDQTLLHSALSEGVCSVRFYLWKEPTVSLGHFQNAAELQKIPLLAPLPAVRRLSGGGAIVHHHELTYSCAVPNWHPLTLEPRRIYSLVHECIIARFLELGISAQLRGTIVPEKSAEFLCFGRGDDFDVVIGASKILGSAQRRRKGAVLQHGSLALKCSPFAPLFPGIADLTKTEISAQRLLAVLPDAVGRLFANAVDRSELSPCETSLARSLEPQVSIPPRTEVQVGESC